MPYPPAQAPGGYDPYEGIPPAVPPREEPPAAVTPPSYPAGPHPVSPPQTGPAHPPYSIWAQSAATAEKNGLGTGALVTGILSIVMCALVVIGAILGIIAVVLGAAGLRHAGEGRANNAGVARAGLITGAVGIILGVLGWGLILFSALVTG